ncbi:hypothetical protein Trydic_g1449 [Trypoxylus dichotomus]
MVGSSVGAGQQRGKDGSIKQFKWTAVANKTVIFPDAPPLPLREMIGYWIFLTGRRAAGCRCNNGPELSAYIKPGQDGMHHRAWQLVGSTRRLSGRGPLKTIATDTAVEGDLCDLKRISFSPKERR